MRGPSRRSDPARHKTVAVARFAARSATGGSSGLRPRPGSRTSPRRSSPPRHLRLHRRHDRPLHPRTARKTLRKINLGRKHKKESPRHKTCLSAKRPSSRPLRPFFATFASRLLTVIAPELSSQISQSVEIGVNPWPKSPYSATLTTTSNKILGPRRTSSTRIRSSFPCSVFPSSSVAAYGLNPYDAIPNGR